MHSQNKDKFHETINFSKNQTHTHRHTIQLCVTPIH